MKINLLTSALVATVGLAFVSMPVTAQTSTNAATATAPVATSPTPKKEKKKGDKIQYAGSITAIDATSLTVQTPKESVALAIGPKTKFRFNDGKKHTPATQAAFAVGDKVTGSYTKDATGAMTAASVDKPAPAAAASTADVPAQK
jgi:hypothetical protein